MHSNDANNNIMGDELLLNFGAKFQHLKFIISHAKIQNCWFSHDVTKIQTKKLSILRRFYFHDALERLKTNFHTNFRFKRDLGFVI